MAEKRLKKLITELLQNSIYNRYIGKLKLFSRLQYVRSGKSDCWDIGYGDGKFSRIKASSYLGHGTAFRQCSDFTSTSKDFVGKPT